MASEYLKRTPTSNGNRRVFTWSTWVKRGKLGTNQNLFCSTEPALISKLLFDTNDKLTYQNNNPSFDFTTTQTFRDVGSWMHILFVANTTSEVDSERIKLFVNGIRITSFTTITYPAVNSSLIFNYGIGHWISSESSGVNYFEGQFSDIFLVDGQALTPDVFGKYITGKGYISAGTTTATDFKKGQWVPKSPRVIKSIINARGGFGVNGFYLPLNDSNNFGADFHCEPNSIIKLQENLPQPKCRIDGSGTYTTSLRDDPFKQYLIFAQPNVSGGLQNGYGDYSHLIRGSGTPTTITGGTAGTPAISTTQSLYYGSSLYFDGNDTLNVETNNLNYLGGDFTIEFWVWHDSAYPINQMIFNTEPHTSFGISLNRGGTGQTALYIGNGSSWQTTDFRSNGRLYSQQWNHVAVERYNNAITIYHNGVGQTTTTAYMPTGFSSLFRFGTYNNNSGEPVIGYVQDYRVYSGVAKYKGGFDVPRPYTPVGISSWRAIPDCTANNFATLNPAACSPLAPALTNGNLTVKAVSAASSNQTTIASMGVSSGKWYFEVIPEFSYPGNWQAGELGISRASNISQRISDASDSYFFGFSDADWYKRNGGTFQLLSTTSGTTNSSTVMNVAIDLDNGKLYVGKNGVWENSGNPITGTNPTFSGIPIGNGIQYLPAFTSYYSSGLYTYLNANFGQNPTFSGNTTAGTFTDSNGKGLFKYQPPSGFLALCEDNLPTPAIADPGKHFKTVLYTGDGNNGRNITGLGFKPDLVWIKDRNNSSYNHLLHDSVRGTGSALRSSSNVAETGSGLRSFSADGFSISNDFGYNVSGNNHVAWCWKAGDTTQTNTNGTITSTVSVNQTAGFSIVSYTGNGTSGATVGHGLGKTPAFIIIKSRGPTARSWGVYHKSIGNTGMVYLDLTNATNTASFHWNNTSPTSTTFTLGNGSVTNSAENIIAYCWAEIEGFSKFGSYVGNGSADGPFVYCGFKPAWVVFKRIDSTSYWYLQDSSRNVINPTTLTLHPNSTDADVNTSANEPIDFVSNGFKLRGTSTNMNASGGTYIFAAFAESPFQTANAK